MTGRSTRVERQNGKLVFAVRAASESSDMDSLNITVSAHGVLYARHGPSCALFVSFSAFWDWCFGFVLVLSVTGTMTQAHLHVAHVVLLCTHAALPSHSQSLELWCRRRRLS